MKKEENQERSEILTRVDTVTMEGYEKGQAKDSTLSSDNTAVEDMDINIVKEERNSR